ncbi:hypothetical protein A3D85_01760 [Candidatus Amesbacteria bacterium RIFCSPHIGHO2_02_FULL_47_9]|nr:MAG: hypothetical protein A3D85_01760 [Candidatus Amesbacteria bacterium RIFCSPHIGHO2_02_FULL_47_9]OGD07872.1 MAG: hypothetical protein A2899_03045 [Candidatus Amesbacteria bacterium RIFCSPLOWO2_01_FULL_49_25]
MMDSFFSLVMGLAILGVVLYAVFRPKEKSEGHGGKDAYFYIVMFLALMPLFWGVADLGRLGLEGVWDIRSSYTYGQRSAEDQARRISLRMSAIVVALPVYVFHWYKAGSRKKEEMDWGSKRSYMVAVLILSLILVLTVGIWLVYQGFNALLGAVSRDVKQQVAYALPYAVVSAAVWGWHMKGWQELKKQEGVKPTS